MVNGLSHSSSSVVAPKTSHAVGVLVPHSGPAMQHYVDRIAACLRVLLPHSLTVEIIPVVRLRRDVSAFCSFLRTQKHDFYLCIGVIPGQLLAHTMLTLLPSTKKVLLCGSRYSHAKAADLRAIRAALCEHEVVVDEVCITEGEKWREAFVDHAPDSVLAITSFEPRMFQQIAQLAACAREHRVFSCATNVYANHEARR
ncbi:MAG: hypothetical protein PVJ92_01850 [Candidatus Dependentiae bacterium]